MSASFSQPEVVRGDAYLWRCVVTALCFALFGLAALVLGLVVFPLLKAWPGAADRKRRRLRGLLQKSLRLFVEIMRALGGLTYEVSGRERLGRPGQLILANHPTLIDVVFLIAFTPYASCVVKEALWRNPFTRHVVLSVGYISNRTTATMIEDTVASLAQGQSVIIFPEGTRTTPGVPLQFHRGAANIALRAATVVTPVFIRCEPPTLSRQQSWYQIPPRRVHLSLRVGADLDLGPFQGEVSIPVASRALNEYLLKLFTTELRHT
jgi:1-acyl-sn-glycerol-3-phosphate acyltransferase